MLNPRFAVVLVFAALSLPGIAQAKLLTFKCTYTQVGSPEGLDRAEAGFSMTFVYDDVKDSAFMTGQIGSSELLVVRNAGEAVSFIEVTGTGNVMTTTITASGRSVHSRNSVMADALIPSQYYGQCKVM